MQPEMAFSFRLSLNKDRSELPARSDVLQHRFIDRFFELKQVSEYLVRQFRRKLGEHFITLHVGGPGVAGVQEFRIRTAGPSLGNHSATPELLQLLDLLPLRSV